MWTFPKKIHAATLPSFGEKDAMRKRAKVAINKRAVAEIVPCQGATGQAVIPFADAVTEGRDIKKQMDFRRAPTDAAWAN